MKVVKIELDMAIGTGIERWITYYAKNNTYRTYIIIGKKRTHVATFKSLEEARVMAGLINNIIRHKGIEDVSCIKTYCLKKYNNVLEIVERERKEQEKVKYKRTRRYFSMTDIYGEGYSSSSTEDFNYGDKYDDYWNNLD